MKSNYLTSLKRTALEAFTDTSGMRDAVRIAACGAVLLHLSLARAQGFVQGFTNVTNLAQIIVGLLIIIGVVGGLGMVLGGVFSAYKKYDNRNDDIGWGKIALQIGAGGLAMALGWVGTQVVETLGGSSSDIGRSISTR